MHKTKVSSEDEEPQELAHFRREWLAELQKKKIGTNIATATPLVPAVIEAPVTQASAVRIPWPASALAQDYSGPSNAGHPFALPNGSISSSSTTPLPRSVKSALKAYRQAVEHEQRGELDDALILYRQAFRMVRREQVVIAPYDPIFI